MKGQAALFHGADLSGPRRAPFQAVDGRLKFVELLCWQKPVPMTGSLLEQKLRTISPQCFACPKISDKMHNSPHFALCFQSVRCHLSAEGGPHRCPGVPGYALSISALILSGGGLTFSRTGIPDLIVLDAQPKGKATEQCSRVEGVCRQEGDRTRTGVPCHQREPRQMPGSHSQSRV